MEIRTMDGIKAAALAAALVATGAFGADADRLTPEERAKVEKRMEELSKEMRDLGRRLGQDRRFDLQRFERVAMNRAMLGINVDAEESAEKGDGVHIAAVTPRGPAAAAGLRAGDVLTAIDGKSLRKEGERDPFAKLREHMEGKEAGDEVKLKVLRDGKTLDVAVKAADYAPRAFAWSFGPDGTVESLIPPMAPLPPMGPRPPSAVGPGMERFRWFTREWGDLEMVSLSPKLGEYFGAKEGVLVVHAPADGAIKLQDGDVITKVGDRKPSSPEQVLRILRSYDAGEKLKVEVLRNRKPLTLEVEVPERGDRDAVDIIVR